MRRSHRLASLKSSLRKITPPSLLARRRPLHSPAAPEEPSRPEWEYVPEGWGRRDDPRVAGWEVATVLDAYRAKLPEFRRLLEGTDPIAVATSAAFPVGPPTIEHQNQILAFAYALALASRTTDSITVLDWGGGLGFFYFLSRALLPREVGIEYHCKEVPNLCTYGREALPEISFHSDDSCLDDTYDFVLASSSLQYSEDWEHVLQGLAGAAHRYLFLTRVPVVFSHPSFVVLQRTYAHAFKTEYLSWVLNRGELLERAARSGLKLVREFLLGDKPPVLGAPEQDETRGFLFRPAPKP
jgi:putative methyltransferase (TIGR04325 family)